MHKFNYLSLIALIGFGQAAWAESDINSGVAAGLSAQARLDVRVAVPRIIFLRIGTGTNFADNGTRNRVTFTVLPANLGSGTAVIGTPSAGPILARVLANGGNVSFRASGTNGGLASGANRIAWTQIVPSVSGGSLPHPPIGNGAPGAVTTLVASAGIVDQSATYTFAYSNSVSVPTGTYNGRVTYTASLP
jgi:hypothetical protein